jgi:hypothetical protein
MPVVHARRRRLALAGSVMLIVAGSAPAAAQVPWLAPVALSGSDREVIVSSLGFDAVGGALVTWRGDRARDPNAPAQHYVGTAARAPAGRWTAGDVLTGRLLVHEVALYGRGRALLVGVREDTAGSRSRSRLVYAWGRSTGRFGRLRTLDRGPVTRVTEEGPRSTLFSPRVAASPVGHVLVAWVRAGTPGVSVAVRAPRGRLSAPRTLARRGTMPATAMSARGDGLVVWLRGTRVEARVLRASGRWRQVELVGRAPAYLEVPAAVAIRPGGRARVAWTNVDRSLTDVDVTHVAAARSRAGTWRRQMLERFSFQPDGATSYVTDRLRIGVAFAGSRGYVAWPGIAGGRVRVKVAPVGVDQPPVGAPEVLPGSAHVALEGFAGDPGGRLVASWFEAAADGSRLFAAVRAPAGPFGPPEPVSPATEVAHAGSRIALGPSDRALAAWSARAPSFRATLMTTARP